MSTKYFVINSGYKEAEFAIYDNHELRSYIKEDNKKISKNFINNLENILKNSSIVFDQLSFIAANQGPAPFTTLRVSLASINGLNFATGIPLIGINGLEVFLEEYKDNSKITAVILNAYANDLYYGLWDPENKTTSFGCEPVDTFLNYLNNKFDQQIVLIGNGVEFFRDNIKNIMQNKALIPSPLPDYVSIQAIAKKALNNFIENKGIENQIMPIYLKESSSKLVVPIK